MYLSVHCNKVQNAQQEVTKAWIVTPEKIKKAGEIFSCLFKLCVF
jgi:hypothetical protein